MAFNPMTGMFEEEEKFSPSDLLVPTRDPASDKSDEIKALKEQLEKYEKLKKPAKPKKNDYDSKDITAEELAADEKAGENYVRSKYMTQKNTGKDDPTKMAKNMVGQAPAQAMGAYDDMDHPMNRMPAVDAFKEGDAPKVDSEVFEPELSLDGYTPPVENNRTPAMKMASASPEMAQQPELTLENATPEAPAQEAPKSELQEKLSLLEQYKKLTEQKQDRNRNLDLLMGGNQIAQAIASGYGGKIGDGSEAVNQLRKSAEGPVTDLLGQSKAADAGTELEMTDPSSDISKFARQRAIAQATKAGLKPEDIQKLEKMSAKQLEKLGLFKPETSANTRANQLRFERITGPDGVTRTVAINSQTGEVVKDIGQSGFASQFRTDPETGNIIGLSPSSPAKAPVGVTGGKATPEEKTVSSNVPTAGGTVAEAPKADYTSPTALNKVNPNLYKEIKKTQDEFTKDMKESREVATGATNLSHKLTPGPNGVDSGLLGGIQTQAAKMAGQKGVLTDQDLVKFAGAGGVAASMERLKDGTFFGNMSDTDVKFFNRFSQLMKESLAEDIQNRSQIYKKQIHNEAKNYLPGLQETDVDRWLQVDQVAPAAQGAKKDPKISDYAKQHNLDYEKAKAILTTRGYKANE